MIEASPGLAWLEVRTSAFDWIAAERPEWRHPDGRLNAGRIITDSGLPRMTIYRLRELCEQQSSEPAVFDADSIARLVSLGMRERRVDQGAAFDELFKVVCPALDADLVAA